MKSGRFEDAVHLICCLHELTLAVIYAPLFIIEMLPYS
jgi:hypothetical protein